MTPIRALGTAVAAASSIPAFGAITSIDFGDAGLADGLFVIDSTDRVYVDLDTQGVSVGPSRDTYSTEIRFRFQAGYTYQKADFMSRLTTYASGTGSNIRFHLDPYKLVRFGYSQAIGGNSSYSSSYGATNDEFGNGAWAVYGGVAFIGFSNGGNEGWIAVDYQPSTSAGSAELLQLVYGNAGEQLTTPVAGTYAVVPEPAAAGALLAGCAAVFALRRRRKA